MSEATALPRTPSSLVERRRTRAGRAASSPGGASSGGAWPRMGITDPRGDIAGDPAVGYGRFRFHPNIIPRIIISASANSVRTAPQGAARKTSGPAGSNQPGRDVDGWREESSFSSSLYMPNNGVCVVHYPFEYYCNIIIFDGEYEKRHLEYYPKHLYKTEEPQFLLVSSTNTVNLLLSPLPQI